MASNTPNLNLYKKDPTVDGNDTFNIKTMLNDNWDKIDTEVAKKANQKDFNSHLADSTSHVTAAERTAWNSKAEKTYVDEQIQTVTATGIPKLVSYEYDLYATVDNQTVFTIPYDYFNSATDTLIVEISGIDVPKSYYTVTNPVTNSDKSITKGYITLIEGRPKDSFLKMRIFKNVPIGPDGAIQGTVLAIDSIPQNRVQGLIDLNNNFMSHKADNLYQTAGGTATAITLTISGALVTGYPITFIASANNNGSATTINGKPLYKPGTTTAPTLIAGKAYTVWYNATSNCFFIKASAEGNTIPSHVLAGDKFSTDDIIGGVGTMVNYTSQNIEASTPWNNGTNLYFPINSGGYYPGSGNSGVYRTDPNFKPENILSGKSIFGLAGSVIAGKRTASGTVTSSPNNITSKYQYAGGTGDLSYCTITVSGLSFKPSFIYAKYYNTAYPATINVSTYEEISGDMYPKTIKLATYNVSVNTNNYTNHLKGDAYFQTATDGGFTLAVFTPSVQYTWYAVE